MSETEEKKRIHVLRQDVARKIAAGEVIDRPYSVVRELIDNAIDAGSSELALYLENGGITNIRLIDNGQGMGKEDLSICFLAHATSKITEENDIYKTRTLGFRGEALSSIGSCSKLDITSATDDNGLGHKLVVREGDMIALEGCRSKKGTIINVNELFYNMPARKKFLKRASGETTTCKGILLDKALAFPQVDFKLFIDNTLKLFLPKGSHKERILSAYPTALEPSLMTEEETMGNGYDIKIIGGRPELVKKDRRYIQIFVNNRRVYEYSLIQAVQYGYSEYMPGKDYPAAFVFINIDPQLVDFNIHPAKRECRFLNLKDVHHSVVALIQSYLNRFSINIQAPERIETEQTGFEDFEFKLPTPAKTREDYSFITKSPPAAPYAPPPVEPTKLKWDLEALKEKASPPDRQDEKPEEFQYLGQVFNLFLVVEYNQRIFIVDQHAAHEKVLYEKFLNHQFPMQELMFPISFEVEDYQEQQFLDKNLDHLLKLGIKVVKAGSGVYEIEAVRTDFNSIQTEELIEFIKNKEIENLEHALYSMAACKSAIKDGDVVDPLTAVNLLKEAFKLENARCPHGRPIWHTITREELFRLMGRK